VIAALHYEWVRISTIRSTKILLALTLVLGAGLGWLATSPMQGSDEMGNPVGPEIIDWYQAFTVPLALAAVLASVVAAQAIGQEYRFGLIRLTLTAFPDRVQVLIAKLSVVGLAGVVFALVSLAGSEIAVTLRGHPLPPDYAIVSDSTLFLRGVVFVVLWSLSAFAIAGVTRQTALGIAVPVISGLIVENILSAVLRERADWLVTILPWSAASRWAQQPLSEGQESFGPESPVAWTGIGIFAVWVVAFLAFEFVTFLRRDA
jgi:ABC-2 type transport system permease protein